eukprot:g12724.t1
MLGQILGSSSGVNLQKKSTILANEALITNCAMQEVITLVERHLRIGGNPWRVMGVKTADDVELLERFFPESAVEKYTTKKGLEERPDAANLLARMFSGSSRLPHLTVLQTKRTAPIFLPLLVPQAAATRTGNAAGGLSGASTTSDKQSEDPDLATAATSSSAVKNGPATAANDGGNQLDPAAAASSSAAKNGTATGSAANDGGNQLDPAAATSSTTTKNGPASAANDGGNQPGDPAAASSTTSAENKSAGAADDGGKQPLAKPKRGGGAAKPKKKAENKLQLELDQEDDLLATGVIDAVDITPAGQFAVQLRPPKRGKPAELQKLQLFEIEDHDNKAVDTQVFKLPEVCETASDLRLIPVRQNTMNGMSFCPHPQCKCWFLRTERARTLHRYAHDIADKLHRQANPTAKEKAKQIKQAMFNSKAAGRKKKPGVLEEFVTADEARERQKKDKKTNKSDDGPALHDQLDANGLEDDADMEAEPAAKKQKVEEAPPQWVNTATKEDLSEIVTKGVEKWAHKIAGTHYGVLNGHEWMVKNEWQTAVLAGYLKQETQTALGTSSSWKLFSAVPKPQAKKPRPDTLKKLTFGLMKQLEERMRQLETGPKVK